MRPVGEEAPSGARERDLGTLLEGSTGDTKGEGVVGEDAGNQDSLTVE